MRHDFLFEVVTNKNLHRVAEVQEFYGIHLRVNILPIFPLYLTISENFHVFTLYKTILLNKCNRSFSKYATTATSLPAR